MGQVKWLSRLNPTFFQKIRDIRLFRRWDQLPIRQPQGGAFRNKFPIRPKNYGSKEVPQPLHTDSSNDQGNGQTDKLVDRYKEWSDNLQPLLTPAKPSKLCNYLRNNRKIIQSSNRKYRIISLYFTSKYPHNIYTSTYLCAGGGYQS